MLKSRTRVFFLIYWYSSVISTKSKGVLHSIRAHFGTHLQTLVSRLIPLLIPLNYYYYVIFYIIGQNYNFTSSHFTYDIYNNLFIYQAPSWKMRKYMWKCFTLSHKNKAVKSIPNQHLKSIKNKLRWNAKEFPRLFIGGLFNFIFHKHQSLGQLSGQSWWNPPTHSIHSSLRIVMLIVSKRQTI